MARIADNLRLDMHARFDRIQRGDEPFRVLEGAFLQIVEAIAEIEQLALSSQTTTTETEMRGAVDYGNGLVNINTALSDCIDDLDVAEQLSKQDPQL